MRQSHYGQLVRFHERLVSAAYGEREVREALAIVIRHVDDRI
jgi:hypothetical protein